MPSANDYGTQADSTLVPSSLIVFRHFLYNTRLRQLTPMNYDASPTPGAFSFSMRLRPYERGRLGLNTGKVEGQVYEARCNMPGGNYLHESPEKACSCGFYAHYAHDTDFYPQYRWGREYSLDSGKIGAADTIVVRAVIEVTGRTVAGRLGVRAQRMKIKALAPDWGKHITPSRRPRVDPYGFDPFRVTYELPLYRDEEYTEGVRDGAEAAEARHDVEWAASEYGADFYDAPEEMYARYPEPDLEALGIDTTPKPKSDAVLLTWAQVQQKVQSLPVGKFTVYYDDEPITFTPPEKKATPMQRAIEAKRNRPAPPGSGIDWRK